MDHSSEGHKDAAKRPAHPHDVMGQPSRRLKQPPASSNPAGAAAGQPIEQQQQQQWPPYGGGAPPYGAAHAAIDPMRQQQMAQHHQQQQRIGHQPPAGALAYQDPNEYYAAAGTVTHPYPPAAVPPQLQLPPQPAHYLQPKQGRLPADRPLMKLSVSLIDTYKSINTIYYEERDARMKKMAREKGKGPVNNGWDDENYDYVVTPGEIFFGRYKIKERIGKGSFGQVVRAEDTESKTEVAIKIIKSKKPFALQAKTEIELLTHLLEKDPDDQHNIGKSPSAEELLPLDSHILTLEPTLVRLLTHFVYRGHQCLVFEMLSLNLYELLKNTQFGGVSLNLIRKFAKQVLRALAFLAREDVDVIHCDLKPENILLRHPKKSGVKVIDFGSSCRSNKRMYSYIQSRFYRSPEVILGLPYSVKIDMWSLGCILAEMHTGEPLFSGSDQFDQMQKIVKLLGMVPDAILQESSSQCRKQFFYKDEVDEWQVRQTKLSSKDEEGTPEKPEDTKPKIVPSLNPVASLREVITAGSNQKKKFPQSEVYNTQRNYKLFVDLVFRMLAYQPSERIKPEEALLHPFITSMESPGGPVPATAGDPASS